VRYIVKAAALVIVLVLLVPNTILAAGDYISDAAQALQHAAVYVAPGTEGTDNDTAGRLQTRLNKKDNIVLVMLPAAAEAKLGVDIPTIATALSKELGDQRIIGLAVGNNVVGYAPILPAGVAADQMRRARSVSNDPITALGTFAQNIHLWESENPLPTPTPKPPPLDSTEEGGLSWLWWIVIAVVGFWVVCIALLTIRSMVTPTSTRRTHFKAPDQVKDLLAKIAKERDQIHDASLKDTLYQMCLHIERYFAKTSKDKKSDALFFRDRLTEVSDVLTSYLDIQQNEYYYEDARAELERGGASIVDFSQYVLDRIRHDNTVDLTEYKVNTNILQAQRYRSSTSKGGET